MSYSIKAIIKDYSNTEGKRKVFIQVIYRRMKVYSPTVIQVPSENFVNGVVVKHPKKQWYNDTIADQRNDIEKKLLDALRRNKDLTKRQLQEIVKGKTASTDTIEDYMTVLAEELKDKLSSGRISQLKTVVRKVNKFEKDAKLSTISVEWLRKLEAWLRKQPGRDGLMEPNTVQTKMKMVHAICGYARKAGLIEEKQYKDYQMPAYGQKIPTYLSETELDKFYSLLKVIQKPGVKLAGYYFYLSCNTGYRISDAKKFNYSERVIDEKYIVLRAKKNGEIVSIPIHSKLREVLDYIKDKPLIMSEQHVRQYVKEISVLCGIKKNVNYHSSRHSWGMLLTAKGFSVEEVAETLGDTVEVARIYARIINVNLHKKITDRLG
jgi:integrase/recombinase XerD